MKKTLAFVIVAFTILLAGCVNPKYKNLNDSNAGKQLVKYDGTILYTRLGEESGLYKYDIPTSSTTKIATGLYEDTFSSKSGLALSGRQGTGFYSGNYQQVYGSAHYNYIYSYMYDKKYISMLANIKNITDGPVMDSSGERVLCVQDGNVCIIDAASKLKEYIDVPRGTIKDIAFMGKNDIVYSRRVYTKGASAYQLCKYNLESKVESRLDTAGSSALNPVPNPAGNCIAYFKYVSGRYSPCICGCEDIKNNVIINNDIGVGGTIKWSNDGRYLLYIRIKPLTNAQKEIRVVDVLFRRTYTVGSGYAAAFSPDGKNVVFACYVPENGGKQIVSCADIYGNNNIKIFEFYEAPCYAKSVNMLVWNE